MDHELFNKMELSIENVYSLRVRDLIVIIKTVLAVLI